MGGRAGGAAVGCGWAGFRAAGTAGKAGGRRVAGGFGNGDVVPAGVGSGLDEGGVGNGDAPPRGCGSGLRSILFGKGKKKGRKRKEKKTTTV